MKLIRGLQVLVFIFLIGIGIHSGNAQENNSPLSSTKITALVNSGCYPSYDCLEWSACSEGLQTRTCVDKRCGQHDIVERSFCVQGCSPKIECTQWSPCMYTDKTNDLLKGEVRFGGYHQRFCKDVNNCVESFNEEELCEDSFPLQLQEKVECGKNYLEAFDPKSKRVVAKISLEDWNKSQVSIMFTQGDTKYCPSCYNGIKDTYEESIDCGGECKKCSSNIDGKVVNYINISLWAASVIFIGLVVHDYLYAKREGLTGFNPNRRYRKAMRVKV